MAAGGWWYTFLGERANNTPTATPPGRSIHPLLVGYWLCTLTPSMALEALPDGRLPLRLFHHGGRVYYLNHLAGSLEGICRQTPGCYSCWKYVYIHALRATQKSSWQEEKEFTLIQWLLSKSLPGNKYTDQELQTYSLPLSACLLLVSVSESMEARDSQAANIFRRRPAIPFSIFLWSRGFL